MEVTFNRKTQKNHKSFTGGNSCNTGAENIDLKCSKLSSHLFLLSSSLSAQLTVVVKYFFQFGFFPWTTSAYRGINAERAFAVPNIVGVEKKDGYVLVDLIQLIALFFHRSILKVLDLPRNLHKKLYVDVSFILFVFIIF